MHLCKVTLFKKLLLEALVITPYGREVLYWAQIPVWMVHSLSHNLCKNQLGDCNIRDARCVFEFFHQLKKFERFSSFIKKFCIKFDRGKNNLMLEKNI